MPLVKSYSGNFGGYAMKVMTLVGTRPELIKLSRVICELDKYTQHVLVHSGQNYDYELNQVFFDQLEIRKPDEFLNAAGNNAIETIAGILNGTQYVLEKHHPDAVLILGDTNSCLAAIAVKKKKIPIFHMEAGNRCFDARVPEETNRKIVDHVSDVNLPYTEHARRYLLAEGIRADTVIKTGSPMKEVINHYRGKIDASLILDELAVKPQQYFVISAHREENVDVTKNLMDLCESVNDLVAKYRMKAIFSVHPRTRKRLDAFKNMRLNPLVHLVKPLGFLDYVKLEMNAFCVLSDSGTLTEESSILGFPAITIRQAHERPEGMDEGTLIMSGLGSTNVLEAVHVVTSHAWHDRSSFRTVPDYDTENVSRKVLRIILSYTDFVNRTTWVKNPG